MLKRLSLFLILCGLLLAAQHLMAQGSKSPLEQPEPVFTPKVVPGGSITIEKIDGLAGEGQLKAGQKVTFYLRYTNNTGRPVAGFSNGFRVYSPDGATWGTTTSDSTGGVGRGSMDGGVFFVNFGIDGAGADTVGFGGFRIMKEGISNEWSGTAFTITIGPISPSMAGKKICLDQSYFPPGGVWLWSLDDQSDNLPDWGGPYCFTIVK